MATFAELFTDYLEELMSQGGSPTMMTAVVEEYNECVQEGYKPGDLFREWLESGKFTCSTCRRDLVAQQLKESPSPQDEVTCDSCRALLAEENGDASTPA